jgi:hypothetical protein
MCGKITYSVYFLKITDPSTVEDKEYELCRECANFISDKISKNQLRMEIFLKQTSIEDLDLNILMETENKT